MSSFFDALSNVFHRTANGIRDASLSPEELKVRDETKRGLEIAKLAAIVATVVFAIFFAIFPCLFTALLTLLVGFCAWEATKVANNYLEILNKAVTEASVKLDKNAFYDQLVKGTFVAGPVIRAIDPLKDPKNSLPAGPLS